MKQKNTLQKGTVRYIVFREGVDWYAAGLEFNIVESGTTPQEAMLLLFEAIAGYLGSARKIKARPNILNQKPDKEYEALWHMAHEEKSTHKTLKDIFAVGELNLARPRT